MRLPLPNPSLVTNLAPITVRYRTSFHLCFPTLLTFFTAIRLRLRSAPLPLSHAAARSPAPFAGSYVSLISPVIISLSPNPQEIVRPSPFRPSGTVLTTKRRGSAQASHSSASGLPLWRVTLSPAHCSYEPTTLFTRPFAFAVSRFLLPSARDVTEECAGVSTMMGTGLMAYARYLQTKVKGTQWV